MIFTKLMKNNRLYLSEYAIEEASCNNDFVNTYYYNIILNHRVVGICDLRVGMNEELYYAGNIGYHIYERYRGNGYAYLACLELFKIAKEKFKMASLIITCSPENIGSRKTIEKLDGILLETVDVPSSHWLYERGEKIKNIYRFYL